MAPYIAFDQSNPYYPFDFKAAWLHVAKPAFNVLAQNLRDLYLRVADEAGELTQQKNLSMPWPDSDLQGSFEEIPSEVLAVASRTIFFYGHWYWHGKNQHPGAYWKFADYADQVLRARCGLPVLKIPAPPRGISYQVHQGLLRACFNSPDLWTWVEFGLATPSTLEKARAMFPEGGCTFSRFEKAEVDLPKALYPKEGMVAQFQNVADTYKESPNSEGVSYMDWLNTYGGKLMGTLEYPNPSRYTQADLPRLRSLRADWEAGVLPLIRLEADLDAIQEELKAEEECIPT